MKILFIGDSLTTGEGVNPYQTWPVMISKTLHEQYPNVLCQILAWPGDTTRICLERMAQQPGLYECDIAVVQFGLNDKNCWESDKGLRRVSKKAFWANITEIENKLDSFGAKYIIVYEYENKEIEEKYLLFDNVHLNKKGHNAWHDRIYNDIKKGLL